MNESDRLSIIRTNWRDVLGYVSALGLTVNSGIVAETSRRVAQLTADNLDDPNIENLGRLIDGVRLVADAYEFSTPAIVDVGRRVSDHCQNIWNALARWPIAA